MEDNVVPNDLWWESLKYEVVCITLLPGYDRTSSTRGTQDQIQASWASVSDPDIVNHDTLSIADKIDENIADHEDCAFYLDSIDLAVADPWGKRELDLGRALQWWTVESMFNWTLFCDTEILVWS